MLIIVIYLVLAIVIVIPILYWMYFKIKNPFWSRQPVNHRHHFYRKYMKPFVIAPSFYNQRFINPLSIKTHTWNDFNHKPDFQTFIGNHFYNKNGFKYLPNVEVHIDPYFSNDKNAYVSTYRHAGQIVGTITNRTLRIHYENNSFNVSYIDFLCVHQGHRKQMVAPELIQTHEYFQRNKSNKKCLVSLFKKEGTLHNFSPLTQYTTYVCDLKDQTHIANHPLPTNLGVFIASLSTLNSIMIHMSSVKKYYSCFIHPSIETISDIVERKSIQICGLINRDTQEAVASYWFRDTGFYADSDKPNVECFASMFDRNEISINEFIAGFFNSVIKISKEYNYLQLERIGDNTFVPPLKWKYKTPCAYYLYNYSCQSLENKKVTIIA